ncbi:MAG: DUF975 family protein [Treponema sp.]|nr:DUF975 family protein [Treponema sp.]
MDVLNIKTKSKELVGTDYWPTVGFFAASAGIIAVATLLTTAYVGYALVIFCLPIIEVSTAYASLKMYRGQKCDMKDLFTGFNDYWHIIGGYWYTSLFASLWSLLFIVPGIIKSISYSMVPYILMDQPNVDVTEAIKLSMKMTDGHKKELFKVYLSCFGWELLASITECVVGVFFAYPYVHFIKAGVYEDIKAQYNGVTVES